MRRVAIAVLCFALGGCGGGVSATPLTGAVAPGSPSITTPPGPGGQARAGAGASAERFEDGLPRSVGGEPVLRGTDVLDHARAASTDAPFLVGVWLDVYKGNHFCPVGNDVGGESPDPPGSWVHECPEWVITPSDEAGSGGSVLKDSSTATFRFATGLASGPMVLLVHVHDRRASDCGGDRVICDQMIVVDRAVWTGDALTEPGPLTVEATLSAIGLVDATASLRLLGDHEASTEAPLPNSRALAPKAIATAGGQLTGVYVLPSVAAMERALPAVEPGVAGSLLATAFHWSSTETDAAGHSKSLTARWLVVKNVALSVLTKPRPSLADRAYLELLAFTLGASAP